MSATKCFLLAVICAIVGTHCGGSAGSESRPNVVLIISDDHGWPDYGFMGHTAVRTPALDRLASQSMVYTRGYVPTPLCRPSLATIATGLYPHQHGITGNDPPGDEGARRRSPARRAAMEAIFARNENVMELLARSGYVSHQSGKWWEGNPLDHGFTAAMTHGDVTRRGRHGDDGLVIGREGMEPIFDFIESRGTNGESSEEPPFFIWYAPFLPHTPHNPPERLVDRYRDQGREESVAKYLAMVEWLDETVGQFLEYLEQRGLAQDTLVLYVADNGWLQSPTPTNQRMTRAKMSPFEMGVRTPIMIRWPAEVAAGRDDETLVSSIDLVPTILGAVGIEGMSELPGIDLRDRTALASRDRLFGATFAHTSVDLEDPVANLKYRTVVRADGWKLIEPYGPNREVTLLYGGRTAPWMRLDQELYQVIDDPHEREDRAGADPALVQELHVDLQSWWEVPQ